MGEFRIGFFSPTRRSNCWNLPGNSLLKAVVDSFIDRPRLAMIVRVALARQARASRLKLLERLGAQLEYGVAAAATPDGVGLHVDKAGDEER
jgi:hypothetical protein